METTITSKFHRAAFQFKSAEAIAQGEYDIVAITAGTGNGWKFTPAVLQSSAPLWEGVFCFVDHALGSRSIRDIAGVLKGARYDESIQGIRATLKLFGPAAEMLQTLAEQLISQPEGKASAEEAGVGQKIGFSADLSFMGSNHKVDEILKVFSVDLVVNPARGGKFMRGMNSKNRLTNQKGDEVTEENEEYEIKLEEKDEQTEGVNAQLQEQLDEAVRMRRNLAAFSLEQMLTAARLPKPSAEHLRKRFAGKDFSMEEVNVAIDEQRQLLSALTASESVRMFGRIDAMFNEADRLQVAVDDLFGVPRAASLAGATVPKLSGIRELYLSLTGDLELHGGYDAERVQLATTADFTGLVKNALNKLVANTWDELGRAGYDWWKYISVQEHFSTLHPITGTLVGTVGALPAVAEGGTYTELAVGDSPETANFIKYGGYIPLTLELIDRDETRKLRAYTRELASAGMRNISSLVSAIFTSNAGIGPTMADGGALFNATAVTTAGGHANLSTTALSSTSWDAISANVYKQPMLIKNAAGIYGTGPQLAVNPKFLLVPRPLQKTAREICEGNFVRESGYVYDNVLKGSAVPVTVPDWTDTNNWAAACDPLIAPAVFIGERFGLMPEIFVAGSEHSPAVFTNDEHRLKVRHFLAVWVNDYRPLYKCNVA